MKIFTPLLACLLVVAVSNVADAYPSFGGNCTGCHATGDGNMNITPDPIDIAIDSNGVITFAITSLPSDRNVIALAGADLDDLDLDATINTPDNWTLTNGNYISDTITSIQDYVLDLGIGAGAVENLYGIGAWLVGGNGTNTPTGASYDFNVNVVPEPVSLALLSGGLLCLVGWRRRRRR